MYLKENELHHARKIHFNLSDLTSLLFLICMNLNYLLGLSQLNIGGKSVMAEYLFAAAGIAFVIFHSITKRGYHYSVLEFIAIAFALSMGFFSLMRSGAMTFVKLILFWLGCRGVEDKKLLKYEAWSLIISAGFIVATSIIGITSMRYWGNNAVFSFGFKNPNNLPSIITAILFAYCLSRDEPLTIKSILFQILITLIMYRSTGSRSALMVLLMFYVLLLICRIPLARRFFESALRFLPCLYIFLSAVSYYVGRAYVHSNVNWLRLNYLLSWRPYLWNKYASTTGLTLFGNRLEEMGTLDNAYLVLLLRYGLIVFFVYVLMFSNISKMAYRKIDLPLGLAIICYEAYFMFEFTPILVNINPLLLIGISMISLKNIGQNETVQRQQA